MDDKQAELHMRRALRLARKGAGRVSPNPLVGAVLFRDGKIVGEGAHRNFGGPHAEVEAIRTAGEKATGATLFVTLEPCCHHGKTPPCTDLILESKIAEVFCGIRDPFPEVAGKGIEQLRKAGVAVRCGILENECELLNEGFISRIQRGRPFVTLKSALTLDGKTACRTGDSKWITSEASRARVHRMRFEADGVLTGIGTVLKDNPLLTPRTGRKKGRHVRIVLDPAAETPPGCNLVQTIAESPVVLFVSPSADAQRKKTLEKLGVRLAEVPESSPDRLDLEKVLEWLGREMQMNHILVEAGPNLTGWFMETGLFDRWVIFTAPLILGDAKALPALFGRQRERIADGLRFRIVRVRSCGGDLMVVVEK